MFFFLIAISVYSTELNEYFGKYQSVNPKNEVSFILNEQGVSNLSINNVVIDYPTLTHDYLGIIGGALVFRIEFNDNSKYSNIQLFIVNFEREIIVVTGYYMQYQMNNEDDYTLLKTQALELCFIPIPDS